ncbi:MAG: V-type ATP synthase subunit C [Thermodesulfobacteriota bacterium]
MFKDEARYAYPIGVVRSLEAGLLSMEQIETLLVSRDLDGVLKILGETEYSQYLANINNGDYETALLVGLKKLLQLLSRLSLDQSLTDLFLLKYDLLNLKIILKARLTGEGKSRLQSLSSDLGKMPVERLKKAIFEESYSDLPPLLKGAALEAVSAFERDKDPQVIDIVLDRKFYPLLTVRTVESGTPFLKKYFEMVIDLININTLIRIKWRGDRPEVLQKALLDNGSLPKGHYSTLLDSPWDAIPPKFFVTPYEGIVEHGIAHLTNYNSFDKFESLRDSLLTAYLKRARLFTFGIEPLVAYFLIKEKEIETVRMIITAKLNNLPVEGIRERLAA